MNIHGYKEHKVRINRTIRINTSRDRKFTKSHECSKLMEMSSDITKRIKELKIKREEGKKK